MKHSTEGPIIGLALSAGGARGLAHVGVIEVLVEHGYRIGTIAGSSMGALVGGIYAAGRLDEYRDWACQLERRGVVRLLDFAFGSPGFFRGDRVIGALREMVGDHRIEDLPISFTAVATDLHAQREVWLTRGLLFDAIRASIAIPMVFTPHTVDGRELVDGGLLAPLPIAPTRMSKVDWVIAVDVNSRSTPPFTRQTGPRIDPPEPPAQIEPASLTARLRDWIDGAPDLPTPPNKKPSAGLMELMSKSLDTMQARMARMQLALDPPDLVIKVPGDAALFYEFWRGKELIELGRCCALAALEHSTEKVSQCLPPRV